MKKIWCVRWHKGLVWITEKAQRLICVPTQLRRELDELATNIADLLAALEHADIVGYIR